MSRQTDMHGIVRRMATGELSRREAIAWLGTLGMSSSAIFSLVTGAAPRAARAATPAKRGGSGVVRLLVWQAPTILNAHMAHGGFDFDVARLCTEPLLTINGAGMFRPVLAAVVPSLANGGLAADGTSVTYQLRKDVRWADGRPFSADDVIFTFHFIQNKATGAITYAYYQDVQRVEALGPYTVKITFKHPTPAWYQPFVGIRGQILPRHALDAYVGDNARYAPFNTKAFGTGPYKVELFRPGDLVVYSINEYFREPNKPAFDRVEFKGGGDATSAARAVLETGEYDYAYNLQVEWPVLEQIARGTKGVVITEAGVGVEQIFCNMTDPTKELDGQRSSIKAPHPFLTDLRVRQALGLAIDRETIAKQLYGLTGAATGNVLTIPTRLSSKNTKIVFDLLKANQLLDEAGWMRGPDGIRVKGGVKLQITYTTTENTLRQKEQQIVKAGWEKLGVATTLKSVDGGVFFSSAPGNPDTYSHFYADMMMFTTSYSSPFPSAYMRRFYSGDPARDLSQKENNWSGLNISRWVNQEYNQLYDQALAEFDSKKADQMWVKMNDLVANQAVTLPLVDRKIVSARAATLDTGPNLTPFDGEEWNIADWRRRS